MNPLLRLHLLCFPPACRSCRRLMGEPEPAHPGYPYLCCDCWQALPWASAQPCCPACGAELGNNPDRPCPGCAGHEWALERVWSACVYVDPVRQWIWTLKYSRVESLSRLMGRILAGAPYGMAPLDLADLVVPVPLHRWRLVRRGFNQSQLLAHRWLAEIRAHSQGTPALHGQLLRRHRSTRPQAELSAAERPANVSAAFSLASTSESGRRGIADALAGKRVVLLDDVMTSGATLEACARVLRQAGAASVSAVVLARA